MNNAFFLINKKIKQDFLLKNNLLTQRSKYLCGISGGQDSIFLLIWLLHLKNKWNFNLTILHCQHLWQQSNFLSFRQLYRLSYFFNITVCFNLSEVFFFNEVGARNWRYEAYNRVVLFENCERLILGHTATDQAETALLNLIRGTSPQGLCSLKEIKNILIPFYIYIFPSFFFKFQKQKINSQRMKNKCYLNSKFFSKQIVTKKLKISMKKTITFFFYYNIIKFISVFKFLPTLVCFSFLFSYQSKKNFFYSNTLFRLLIFLHRNDITVLSQFYAIPIINDFSNLNVIFSRNKIRHQVFPKFRALFNLPFDYKFYQYLQILLEEQNYIDNIVKNLIIKTNKVDKKIFKKLPIALQRRYMHLVLESYIKRKCNYLQIEFILFLLKVN